MVTKPDYDLLATPTEDDDDLVTQLRAALKASNRERKAAEGHVRDVSLKAVLKDYKPQVAKYVPATVTDEESFREWLESDDGAIFADMKVDATPAPAADKVADEPAAADPPEVPGGDPTLDPNLLALLNAIKGLEGNSVLQAATQTGETAKLQGLTDLNGLDPRAIAEKFQSGELDRLA